MISGLVNLSLTVLGLSLSNLRVNSQAGGVMGIWIETGVFLLVLAFGIWQIQDVKKERRKRSQAREEASAQTQKPSDPP